VRRLRLEIGRCVADLESHVLLPYAAALVFSRPSAVLGSTGITNRSLGSLYPRRQGAHPSDVVVENRYAEGPATIIRGRLVRWCHVDLPSLMV